MATVTVRWSNGGITTWIDVDGGGIQQFHNQPTGSAYFYDIKDGWHKAGGQADDRQPASRDFQISDNRDVTVDLPLN